MAQLLAIIAIWLHGRRFVRSVGMANGYRCSTCSRTYPFLADYKTCPACETETWFGANLDPMSVDDAKHLKAHEDFKRAYPDGQSFTACSICAHEINSVDCPHPWAKPFTDWPADMLAKLRHQVKDAQPS